MGVLRVAGTSCTTSLAGAIAWRVRQEGRVEVEAIGAGAVNQAVKAVAVARTYVAPEGLDLWMTPHFVTVELGDERRSAIRMEVWSRSTAAASQPAELVLEEDA